MKRYITASWNGFVPVKTIIEETGLDRKEAKVLREYLYQRGYDSGFRNVAELLHAHDLKDVYNDMCDERDNNPKWWKANMED